MRIRLVSVLVRDQQHALRFYTEVLGFVKKIEIPMGEHAWLTVVPREEPDGPEVVLEPMGFPPARTYQQALFEAGIPLTAFQVNSVDETYRVLVGKGVAFSMPPTVMGTAKLAVFDDTCGNNIQVFEVL
ncbi:MAG TPA: VOC family protein [Puia sp.]|nr:VOC family protein [Puia sp.]